MVINLQKVREWASERDVYVAVLYRYDTNTDSESFDVTITLKSLPSFSITDAFDLNGNELIETFLESHLHSLKIKQKEDMKNFEPRKSVELSYDALQYWSVSGTVSGTDYKINSDYCLDLGNGWYRSLAPDHLVKTESKICDTCKGVGMVDYGFYGAAECPDCKEQYDKEQKEEKTLSAWDKKLKEELENGDDIWGSISKKYKRS